MRRLILDTNIYGNIAKEKQPYEILKKIQLQNTLIFYGIKEVIRREIRETPKEVRIIDDKSLRMILLSLYDSIIKEHELKLNERIQFIAERYYEAYKKFGGVTTKDRIINDFLIIACASVKGMDVVVSEDNNTMLSEYSLKSYDIINKTLKLRTPEFIDYAEFKRWFSL